MARRRLNKKVALIGSAVFIILALGAVLVILRLTRDPAQFVADGDAAWAAQDYEAARRNYGQALGLTRVSGDKLELYFKLADVFQATGDWPRVLGSWEQIITSDPQNIRARLGRIKYFYIMADSLSGVGQNVSAYWKDVSSQATELIEIADQGGLMEKGKAEWEPDFGTAEPSGWDGGAGLLGAYLYGARGRAALELASMGASNSPGQLLTEAKRDLQKARELDPSDSDAHRHLAEAFLAEAKAAESRGNHDLSQEARKQADEVLAAAIDAAGDVPGPHISLLIRRLSEARRRGVPETREMMRRLEPEYRDLLGSFPASAEAFSAAADYFSLYSAFLPSAEAAEKLDSAIDAIEKACALDQTSVKCARMAAGLHYRRFSLYADTTSLTKAIELAEAALELPEAQDHPGPRRYARQTDRFSLCALLATLCLEQTLVADTSEAPDAAILAKAEKAVHEIEQIQGSGDNPQVVKWKGMLDLAGGRKGQAIRRLYGAYEEIKASKVSNETDAFLSYTLAKVFESTSEVGAVIEFMGSALSSGIINTKPQALLDYADVLFNVASYDIALSAINSYEERFGVSGRSQALRIKTLVAKGHMTEAEEALSRLDPADPNTLNLNLALVTAKGVQLQEAIGRRKSAAGVAEGTADDDAVRVMTAELHDGRRRQAELVGRLLQTDPASFDGDHLRKLCEALAAQGDIEPARMVVEAFLTQRPDSMPALFYQGLLSEPDPVACPESRRKEIHVQAVQRLADPVAKVTERGFFYQQENRLDEAAVQWRKVLGMTAAQGPQAEPGYLRTDQVNPRYVAAGQLFDIARHRLDWALAEEMVEVVTSGNLDDCQGQLYAGRLALAQGQHKKALTHLDACLEQRPVFSYGYMLRGNIQAALGNEHASVADTRRAAHLNPVDALVAKALANALLVRNRRLGASMSMEQQRETKLALERALQLNPRDTQVLSAYADVIGESEPLTALAIRQTMQTKAPSFNNAVMLGRLATRIAVREMDLARKRAYFAIAEQAFEQARQMDSGNEFMLESYAEYYRVTDQNDKARQLLQKSEDRRLLWRHYYRVGRHDEAQRLLQQLYQDSSSRNDALKGLVLVGEATGDKEGVKRYSEELLSLEDNTINRLAQLRAYLDVGLVKDAEHRLQSFKERFPNEPRILLMEALLAKRQGRLDEALALVNRNLEKKQEDAAAWRLRGEIGLLRGDCDQAILDFRKSRMLADDPVTTVALANAYVWAGRDDEAVSELRGVLKAADAPAHARELLERIYRRLGRHEALEQFYAETLDQLPDSVDWLIRAGTFATERGEYDKAISLYEKACRFRREQVAGAQGADAPYSAALDGYLRALVQSAGDRVAGNASWRPERLDKVFEEGAKHLDTDYAAVALCRMAEAKKKLGDSDAAGDYCRQAVEKAWDDEQLAVEILLRAYLLVGADEVSAYCRQRLETTPDSLAANFTMFNLTRTQNDYDGADGYIDKCVALSGSDTEKGLGYQLKKAHMLTVAHKRTSDNRYLEGAIGVYESLIAKMPTNSSVLNNLAYLLAQNNQRLAEAQRYAEKVLDDDPDNAVYLDTYAYVLHKNGKTAEAERAIAAALQQYEMGSGASAEVYEHLGMIKEALGDRSSALTAYRRALELGGSAMSSTAKERINLAVRRLQ